MEALAPPARMAGAPFSHRRLARREVAGVAFYESPSLASAGVRHAFSTRLGGMSEGPFRSLTLGSPQHHREAGGRIAENWRRLLAACGCAGPVAEVHQVHGGVVARAVAGTRCERDPLADAIVSADPTRSIGVRTADCCPILLASADGREVAAVHAGWRGLVAGVIENAVRAMTVPPGGLIAAVGPCIGFEAFEVGPEVIAAFRRRFGEDAPLRETDQGKGHIDLARSATLELVKAGVLEGAIDAALLCTTENEDEFFSHRRDGGLTGRMAAVIQARR